MKEVHYIKFEPRILKQLGDELVETGYDAVNELVRNSYDSGAESCNIKLINNINSETEFIELLKNTDINIEKHAILIEDNGRGMSKQELIEGFLTVGTTIKLDEKENLESNKRIPVGEKGIGRFSCQKLGRVLLLETESENGERHAALFDWNRITSKDNKITEIPIELISLIPKGTSYTKLWICNLTYNLNYYINLSDNNEQLSFMTAPEIEIQKGLEVSLSHIIFSFENIEIDFKISVEYDGHKRYISSSRKYLDYAESTHSFKLELDKNNTLVLKAKMILRPWYLENVYVRLLGKYNAEKYKKGHQFFEYCLKELEAKLTRNLEIVLDEQFILKKIFNNNRSALEEIKNLIPIHSIVYYYRRRSDLLLMAIESAKANKRIEIIDKNNLNININDLRDFLEHHNGVKLFRNSTRVGRIGAKDDDWLQLQQLRTKGQQFFRFEYGNLVGFIQINDPKQEYIRDVSSRTKLLENQSSTALIDVCKYVFTKTYYEFNKSANEIVKQYFNDKGLIPRTSIDDIEKNSDAIIESINKISNKFDLLSSFDINNEHDIYYFKNEISTIKNDFRSALINANESKRLSKELIDEQARIAAEAYNNFKLMANGLITETITHEMHSILSSNDSVDFKEELSIVRKALFNNKEFDVLRDNYSKLENGFNSLYLTVSDMNGLYEFLEKTFILDDEAIAYEDENLIDFTSKLEDRFRKRFKKNNISFIANMQGYWSLPKGSLVHVFYNLVDNSIYWINEKKRRNKKLNNVGNVPDEIHIISIDNNTIRYHDTGLGVIPKMEDILFGPLISGKKENGRGMGMYIVKQLLNSVNADIHLLNDRNEFGNRYIFEIIRERL